MMMACVNMLSRVMGIDHCTWVGRESHPRETNQPISTTAGNRTAERMARITRSGPKGTLSSNRSPPPEGFGHQALDTLQRQSAHRRITVAIGEEEPGRQVLVPCVGPAPFPVGLQKVELSSQRG